MRYVLLLICIQLTSCALTPEQQAEQIMSRYGPYCTALGLTEKTPEWINCVQQRQANALAAFEIVNKK